MSAHTPPNAHAPEAGPRPWYRRTGVIVALLIAVPPLGIFLLILCTDRPALLRVAGAVASAVWLFYLVAGPHPGRILPGGPGQARHQGQVPASTVPPTDTAPETAPVTPPATSEPDRAQPPGPVPVPPTQPPLAEPGPAAGSWVPGRDCGRRGRYGARDAVGRWPHPRWHADGRWHRGGWERWDGHRRPGWPWCAGR